MWWSPVPSRPVLGNCGSLCIDGAGQKVRDDPKHHLLISLIAGPVRVLHGLIQRDSKGTLLPLF